MGTSLITVNLLLITVSSAILASAQLTIKSSDKVSVLGQKVVMKCSISGSHDNIADWWWVPSDHTELIPIFQSNTLVYLYENHMEVIHGPNGEHDLVIHNIKFSDAGNYTCFDDGRLQSAVDNGYFSSAELVVIDLALNCTQNMSAEGVLGSDICQRGLQPDYINLTCSMRYHGNIAPTLLWGQEGVQGVRSATANNVHIAEHSLITSTTIVQSSETMNGSYFICSASMNWNKNSTQEEKDLNITWTSPIINLLFFERNIYSVNAVETVCSSAMETTCFVHTNMKCQYQWTHPSSDIIVHSSVLKLSQFTDWQGIYQCTVECQVRGQSCLFKASTIIAINCSSNTSTTDHPFTSMSENKSSDVYQILHYSIILIICTPTSIAIGVICERTKFWKSCFDSRAYINLKSSDKKKTSITRMARLENSHRVARLREQKKTDNIGCTFTEC